MNISFAHSFAANQDKIDSVKARKQEMASFGNFTAIFYMQLHSINQFRLYLDKQQRKTVFGFSFNYDTSHRTINCCHPTNYAISLYI